MKLVGSAVRLKSGEVFFLPAPARHPHVFEAVREVHPDYRIRGGEDGDIQGFVLESGLFLNRVQALVVARRAGQVSGPLIGPVLTSEDLW